MWCQTVLASTNLSELMRHICIFAYLKFSVFSGGFLDTFAYLKLSVFSGGFLVSPAQLSPWNGGLHGWNIDGSAQAENGISSTLKGRSTNSRQSMQARQFVGYNVRMRLSRALFSTQL